ncbi:MAG: ABC transporter permease subunit [Treponema sp.]|jgi:putative aldouronate transport system permease protein|nr:ABC transporter permease subunit [Treponema sp.]
MKSPEYNDRKISAPHKQLWKRLRANRWLFLLALPGILYFLLFRYLPMWGLLIAFKRFSAPLGILKSPWVGFRNFTDFFTGPDFFMLFRNTFALAIYNLAFFFPLPIILALMINGVRRMWYKRLVQTITYLPHFMSWVIIASICQVMLTTENGIVNEIIYAASGERLDFLTNPKFFRPMIVVQSIWRETGWGTIIFLAALTGIDPELYDAAHVDGANAWQRLWAITIPAITGTIVTLLILRLGHFLDTGFTQIFMMLNPLNRSVGEVFDTYIYRVGIREGNRLSYTTAVGLFKSFVGLVLVIISDRIAKKTDNEGIL